MFVMSAKAVGIFLKIHKGLPLYMFAALSWHLKVEYANLVGGLA